LFSNTTSDLVFAVSKRETIKINLADGSVTPFKGHPTGNHSCKGDVMALSDDGTFLYVGYDWARCVVAYNVSTGQQIWTSECANSVTSVSYHAGTVLVAVWLSDFTVLSAANGSVLRRIFKADSYVFGHVVVAGTLASV
jgi:outer membrane protein assembly factor BamB